MVRSPRAGIPPPGEETEGRWEKVKHPEDLSGRMPPAGLFLALPLFHPYWTGGIMRTWASLGLILALPLTAGVTWVNH